MHAIFSNKLIVHKKPQKALVVPKSATSSSYNGILVFKRVNSADQFD